MIGLYTFTDMAFEIRYLSVVTVMSIPMIAIYLNQRKRDAVYYGILLALVIGSFGISVLYYRQPAANRTNPAGSEYHRIAQILVEEGYQNGYAGFWHSNILTEISDGKIEVWDYGTTSGGLQIENMEQWLQLKSHINHLPTGKVFALLNSEQLKNTQWSVEPDPSDILYQSDQLTLFGFDSYADVKSHL